MRGKDLAVHWTHQQLESPQSRRGPGFASNCMDRRWLLGESSNLKAPSVLRFLETVGRVHFISFPPQVSCSTEAHRSSVVWSKEPQLHDFLLAFEANLGIVPSYNILPHVTGEIQCTQTGLLLEKRQPADVHLMHLSLSQVFSPWRQTKHCLKSSASRRCVQWGHGGFGREYFVPQICLQWSMLREPDVAWVSWRGTGAVSAIPGTGKLTQGLSRASLWVDLAPNPVCQTQLPVRKQI